MEAQTVKVADLTPMSKSVNVLVKVVSAGEKKDIPTREGIRQVGEFLVADETAGVLLSLWGDQISQVAEGDVLQIKNGYISLVRGSMRLNVGKYGSMEKSEEALPEVNTATNLSDKTHEMPERRGFGYRGGGRGRRGERRRY